MKDFFKRVYSKEYLLFLAIGFLPLLYKVCQIAFLNTYTNAIKILGQIVFLQIIFKIFQETLINPLFRMLGKSNNESKNYYAKKLLVIYSAVCLVFTLAVFFCVDPIMRVSNVPQEIFSQTKTFLQIVVFYCGVNVIVQYLFAFNVISKSDKTIFVYFLIGSVATLVLDIIFVPAFSLGFGVVGIAISMLVVSVGELAYFLVTMPKVKNAEIKRFDNREYAKLCALSFAETLTRNLTYYFVVLVLINTLNNQDLYYIGNEFIWSVMLVPALAQNTLIKQRVSKDNRHSLRDYFLNGILISAYMLVLVPVAFLLFRYVYGFANYSDYFLTLLKLLPGYFVFIFDNVVESFFVASGRMHHVFVQTFITNILVYLSAFVLYVCGVWHVTLNGVIVVFNAGMLLSSLYTLVVFWYIKKKEKQNGNKTINKRRCKAV